MHVIAAKAVAFGEALQPRLQGLPGAACSTTRACWPRCCSERGLRIVSGGTDCHMFLVDLRAKRITGKDAEAALGQAHITVNKNAIPERSARSRSSRRGIRIGSPAITTRGFDEIEARSSAHLIADVLDAPGDEAMLPASAAKWRR